MYLKEERLIENLDMFKDSEFGGYYSAISYDGKNILTREKSLEDQSYILLGMLREKKKNMDKIRNQYNYILSFLDKENGGIVEFTENYGIINELGKIKTTHRTFLGIYSLLKGALYLKDYKLLKDLTHHFLNIQEKVFDFVSKSYISKYSMDYSKILDSNEDSRILIYSILISTTILDKITENEKEIDFIFKRDLLSLIDKIKKYNTIINKTDKYGGIVSDSYIDCEDLALTVLALFESYKLINEKSLISHIHKLVDYMNSNLWDRKYGGYFTHCNIDGKVTIHKEYVTLLTASIPIKSSRVNLFALLANKIYIRVENTISDYNLKTEKYLATLYDKVNKGFFIGEGYFWSPPSTPVGPFQRLMLPNRDIAGTFHFGSTPFLRLYNKYVSSQAIALCVLNYGENIESLNLTKWENTVTKVSLNPMIETDNNINLSEKVKYIFPKNLNTEKHIKWIMEGYTKNIGFGWTPNLAPIGTKPDNTPSIFGTHHSISNLKILGQEIKDSKDIAHWIRCCQDVNGAFAEYPGGPSDVLNTYLALNTLDILGERNLGNKKKCIEFLRSCQNKDGGFGVVPGFKSDLFHSNLAAVSLKTLDNEPKHINKLISYFLESRNDDGGFGEYMGAESDTYSCYRAISTLALYNKEIPNKDKTIKFLLKCQQLDGGFSNDRLGVSSMIATYHCVAALTLLKVKFKGVKSTIDWLISCQTPDGGFSNIPKVTTGTIDEGFAAIQSIAMLLNNINSRWLVFVS